MNQAGVTYYNRGTKCLLSLLVSIHSLRTHYAGEITILSEGDESHGICSKIADSVGASIMEVDSGFDAGKNHCFLAKTVINQWTPYGITIFLDSDTLVQQPIDQLLELAGTNEFCVARFSNWTVGRGPYSKRIREWETVAAQDVEATWRFGVAINTGVLAFDRDAKIFQEWSGLAWKGRANALPDEISCQILLHRHKHLILPQVWNCSCKYSDPHAPDVRIIHYHGRKHCRPGLPYGGDLWTEHFSVVWRANIADVRSWGRASDRWVLKWLKGAESGIDS